MAEEQQQDKPSLPQGYVPYHKDYVPYHKDYVPYPTASYKHYTRQHMLYSWLCQTSAFTLLTIIFIVYSGETFYGISEIIKNLLLLFAIPGFFTGLLAGGLVKFFNLRQEKRGKIRSVVLSMMALVIVYGLPYLLLAPLFGKFMWYEAIPIVAGELVASILLCRFLPESDAEYEDS